MVTPAPTAALLVSDFPSPVVAGALGGVLVTAVDAFGNVTPAYRGTVHLTSTDPNATLQDDHTFTAGDNGRAAFGVILVAAGAQAITATDTADPTLTGTQAGIQVTPAAAVTLTVSGYPSPARKKRFYDFTVTALDRYGNVATGYTGTVTFGSDARRATLPDDYTFTAADQGVHTFRAAFLKKGVFMLSATDTSDPTLAGVQTDIQVIGRPDGDGQDAALAGDRADKEFEKLPAHAELPEPVRRGAARNLDEPAAAAGSGAAADPLGAESLQRFHAVHVLGDLQLMFEDVTDPFGP